MAVLNDIRALFAQCPALKDLEARTDQQIGRAHV